LKIRRAAIYARPDRKEALELAREAFRLLSEQGVEVFYDTSIANMLNGPSIELRFQDVDAVIVIGGDGTLLRVLQLLHDRAPVLHLVRMGRKAFLFEDTDPRQSIQNINKLLEGKYELEIIKRLRVKVLGQEFYALNEAAILALGSKVVGLRVTVDNEVVYSDLEGDGIIVSTPIGSTAYNYSAGGPILHPDLDALSLTPVNPVERYVGPIVVPGRSTVRILVHYTLRPVKLIVDGVVERLLYKGVVVEGVLDGPPIRIARFNKFSRLKAPWLRK
jgi:NAD+ kinase